LVTWFWHVQKHSLPKAWVYWTIFYKNLGSRHHPKAPQSNV
jgi:hypothetical protein